MTTVTVSNGVTYTVSAGLTDINDQVLAGGTEDVSGTSDSVFTASGGIVNVLHGGQISAGFVSGTLDIQSGGTASNTDLEAGTSFNGGSFIGGDIASGSVLDVTGYVNGATVEGTLNASDAQVYNTIVYNGSILCNGGEGPAGLLENTVLRQANEVVDDGGTAYGSVVSSGSTETVYQGGVTTATIISSGGAQAVYGTVSGTINSAGIQNVFSGGYVYGGTDYSVQNLFGIGAIDSATLIGDGGVQSIGSGGTAYGAVISNSGEQDVLSGGRAYNAILVSGGYQQIFSGSTVSGTVVSNGGEQFVNVGSVTSSIIKSGGLVDVLNGGHTSNTVISRGGVETVGNSGAAYLTRVTGISATQIVQSGGVAFDTDVTGLDTLEQVQSGGSSYYGGIVSGGQEQVLAGGQATDISIYNSGTEIVYSGGLDVSALVDTGRQFISAGGLAEGVTIEGVGGAQIICSGGSATLATLSASGVQTVRFGGLASGTTVLAGGTQYVSGIASGTSLSGGLETVDSGGLATFGVVHSASTVTVSSGGKTISQGVGSAGAQVVFSGGTAAASIVYSGGTLTVASGGILTSGLTIDSGGKATISGTAAAGQNIKLATGGSILALGSGTLGASISGFAGTDKIDLTTFAYNSATETYNFSAAANNTSGVLTVSSGGKTETLNLTGSYVTSNFTLSTDGTGGTNIVDPRPKPHRPTFIAGTPAGSLHVTAASIPAPFLTPSWTPPDATASARAFHSATITFTARASDAINLDSATHALLPHP